MIAIAMLSRGLGIGLASVSMLAAALVASLPATAQTVIASQDSASQILDLPIGGWHYNVTFTNFTNSSFASTYPGGLPTLPATAQAIIDDIAAVLNANNVHYAGPPGYGDDNFGIPISESGGNFYFFEGFQVNNGAASGSPSDWIYNAPYGTPDGPNGVNQTEITSFVVLTPIPIAQTISVPPQPMPPRYFGTVPFAVPVSASSGLPVALTSLSPATCDVAGGTTVTLNSSGTTGTCMLQATQEGNGYYLPATPATLTFMVDPTPALTFAANLLGTTPPGCYADTRGINNAGQVIGKFVECVNGARSNYSAILWNGTNPTYVDVSPHWYDGVPVGYDLAGGSSLLGINDAGYIVGTAGYNGSDSGYSGQFSLLCGVNSGNGWATYWPSQALVGGVIASGLPFVPFSTLTFPTGNTNDTSVATAVSNDGWVVGSAPYSSISTVPNAAVLWNGEGNSINLGTGGACGINSAHTIVGSSGVYATIWASPNFTPTTLGSLGTFTGGVPLPSSAAAISNDGWVVGSAETNYSSQTGTADNHPVVWVNGSPTDLWPLSYTLSGTVASAALAINSTHQVVGYTDSFSGPAFPAPGVTIGHATFWDAGQSTPPTSSAPVDLSTVIISGLPPTAVLISASGINNAGWISVDAVDLITSARSAYVLVPTLTKNVATPPNVISGQPSTITAATPSGPGPFTYQWYQGNAGDTTSPILGATQASFTTPALATTTSYWAQITGTNGIVEDTATTTITVAAAPPAVLTAALASTSVDASGNYVATLVITNSGNGSAVGTQLAAANLIVNQNGKALTTPVSVAAPSTLNSMGPGTSIHLSLTFPASAGGPGAAAALRWTLIYSTGSTSGTVRLVLP
ncbi:MAG: hypothetical protein ACLPTF_01330 [Steroidobacteraceae bacterium]